jgi:hypothetical protein
VPSLSLSCPKVSSRNLRQERSRQPESGQSASLVSLQCRCLHTALCPGLLVQPPPNTHLLRALARNRFLGAPLRCPGRCAPVRPLLVVPNAACRAALQQAWVRKDGWHWGAACWACLPVLAEGAILCGQLEGAAHSHAGLLMAQHLQALGRVPEDAALGIQAEAAGAPVLAHRRLWVGQRRRAGRLGAAQVPA